VILETQQECPKENPADPTVGMHFLEAIKAYKVLPPFKNANHLELFPFLFLDDRKR